MSRTDIPVCLFLNCKSLVRASSAETSYATAATVENSWFWTSLEARSRGARVILCRDCFSHFSFRDVRLAIANFKRSNSEYLFATTHTGVREHRDIVTGQGRYVNLQLPPFNFPEPMRLVVEDPELGKCLGVWPLQKLRIQSRFHNSKQKAIQG
jgi:hypothetical protein